MTRRAYPSVPRRRPRIWPAALAVFLAWVLFCGLALPLAVHYWLTP